MAKKNSFQITDWVFVAGRIISRDRIVFIADPLKSFKKGVSKADKKPAAQIIFWEKGSWSEGGQFPWNAVGLTYLNKSVEQIIVLGRDGEVGLWDGAKTNEERITVPHRSVGPLKGIRCIGDELIAYGMGREIYRRVNGAWVPYQSGLPNPIAAVGSLRERMRAKAQLGVGGINAITGTAPNDLYAVGFKGEIYHSDGSMWTKIQSPTDNILRGLAMTPNGEAYICGQLGTMLKLKGMSAEAIRYEGPENLDFFDVAWFKDKLFVADGASIRVLENGKMTMLDMGFKYGIPPAHQLDARDGIILTVAGREVHLSEDGKKWTTIID